MPMASTHVTWIRINYSSGLNAISSRLVSDLFYYEYYERHEVIPCCLLCFKRATIPYPFHFGVLCHSTLSLFPSLPSYLTILSNFDSCYKYNQRIHTHTKIFGGERVSQTRYLFTKTPSNSTQVTEFSDYELCLTMQQQFNDTSNSWIINSHMFLFGFGLV